MTHSVPAINATNFKGQKFTFTFNEFIQLKDHQKKMLISPPLKYPPIITLKGKKIILEVSDTLLQNTTYTLYMGDAIEDNNERNPIPNFEFAFSTGATIDSLSMVGNVTDAFTNKPIEGALVMLYSIFEDSIPYLSKPMHVAKSRKNGSFRVNNLKSIDYKIVTITDANSDYLYNQGGEQIGFLNSPFSKENLIPASDTNTMKSFNAQIRLFKEELASQIITGSDRSTRNAFQVFFSRVPVGNINIKPLNFSAKEPWFKIEPDNNGDTLKYWITDTSIFAIDTMRLAVSYQKTDSLNQLHPTIDSLTLVYFNTEEDNNKEGKGNKNESEKDNNRGKGGGNLLSNIAGKARKNKNTETTKAVNPMSFSISNNGEAKSGVPLVFTLPFPAKEVNADGIMIFNATDSIMEPQVKLVADSISPLKYSITRNWEASKTYKMITLPSTFITYDCRPIDTLKVMFKGADPENFGIINLNFSGFSNGIVAELLNEKGVLVDRATTTKNSTITFKFIKPAKYKLRIIDDQNCNGKWDSGNYLKGIQPETVHIYQDSKKREELNIRANWETDLDFKNPTKQ